RENFSKLGWQANVIWRIAISTYMQFDASTVQVDDLIRGSVEKFLFASIASNQKMMHSLKGSRVG
ncbi:MAG: hypothetical protein ABR991_08435, partial [Terracidiphilus sp.]